MNLDGKLVWGKIGKEKGNYFLNVENYGFNKFIDPETPFYDIKQALRSLRAREIQQTVPLNV
ncbi:MAG: hypothetical protein WC238_06115 [Parcubacteria group bacterium]